jgi:hypothetical protein
MSYLEQLFTKYGTDKGIWGYTPYYEEAMEERRYQVKRVLEIGICGFRDIPNNVVGASLFVWRDYFPNATIYGIDNDRRFVFNDQPGIITACCDAYDPNAFQRVLADWGWKRFDLIVDDAVHDPEPQVKLAKFLLPSLVEGGRYFIEEACPYKMKKPPHEFFADEVKDTGVKGVFSCVTPKPEELVVLVK